VIAHPTAARPAVLVGLMSGTSLDGVSAAVVRFTPEGAGVAAQLLAFVNRPYTVEQRDALAACLAGASPAAYCRTNVELGEWLAAAAIHAMAEAGVGRDEIAAIASHGQTVWHEPGHSTWQFGEAAVIAERTGLPVVSDFRARDVAAGGQGAPLVPIADSLLFAGAEWRALQNLGGIGNVTVVPPAGARAIADGADAGARGSSIRAFDTGPGVAVVDGVVRRLTGGTLPFDEDGRLARSGRAVDTVVDTLLAEPYFASPPPKSTGRELFSAAYVDRLVALTRASRADASTGDVVATAVSLTARSVADTYARFLPEPVTEVLLSGGGARNPAIVDGIAGALGAVRPEIRVRRFDDVFFDGEAKEAVAFALLGWLHINGRPGNVPTATGARGPRVLGKLTPA
jgi:anhydro-N-acetylmuramic acid kinase